MAVIRLSPEPIADASSTIKELMVGLKRESLNYYSAILVRDRDTRRKHLLLLDSQPCAKGHVTNSRCPIEAISSEEYLWQLAEGEN
jgi:hypothetical protein